MTLLELSAAIVAGAVAGAWIAALIIRAALRHGQRNGLVAYRREVHSDYEE